mgnify:CR=1 FL=1
MKDGETEDKVIQQIRKLQALADRGVGGEQINAREMINRLMDKYGITPDQLDMLTLNLYRFSYSNAWERKLMSQLFYLLGDKEWNCYTIRGKRNVVLYECYPEDWLDVISRYEILKRDYANQLKAFYRAFLTKNNLLLPYDPSSPTPSKEEFEELRLAEELALGIRRSVLHKQLEAKGE